MTKQQSAGLHGFNLWALKCLSQLDAAQHVRILDCMGAMGPSRHRCVTVL